MGLRERNHKAALDIGQRIQRAREQRGLERRDLARSSGCHYDTILKVETGQRGVVMLTLADIATGLDMSLVDLVTNGG